MNILNILGGALSFFFGIGLIWFTWLYAIPIIQALPTELEIIGLATFASVIFVTMVFIPMKMLTADDLNNL